MSILRQNMWYGQQRVDVPRLRAQESSICADFDVLAGQMFAGGQAEVISGFEISTLTAGTPATSITLVTANGLLMHPLASESGTIFAVASDQAAEVLNSSNTNVTGSFTANTTNYIGIDLIRKIDDGTVDLSKFIDPNTNLEIAKEVALARTLNYRIVVTTQDFSTMPGVAPVAKVVTDTANTVVSVTDCRPLMFRLGSGGTVPDPQYSYSWPGGRTEEGDNTDYGVGDKAIGDFKTWADAMMTRLFELGGGEYWYSATADRNVTMVKTGSPFAGGDWFEWDGTDLFWQGIKFLFDNSTGSYNTVDDQTVHSAGLTDLADGDCIYVDLDRSSNATLTAVMAPYASLGTPEVPGSRFVMAWRMGSDIYVRGGDAPVGTPPSTVVATTAVLGIVKLSHNATTPLAPIVYSDGAANVANGVVALDANKQASWTATSGTALTTVGQGAGSGVFGTGGATNGIGVRGVGIATGAGVTGTGGNTNGTGVIGTGGSTNGIGVVGAGAGTGAGVSGTGGTTGTGVVGTGGASGSPGVSGTGTGSSAGVIGQGAGSGIGVDGTGGATSGTGVRGVGGATNGVGVLGAGTGSGVGVRGTGGNTNAAGVEGIGGTTNGPGVIGTGTNAGTGGAFTSSTGTAVTGAGSKGAAFTGSGNVGLSSEGSAGGGSFSATGTGYGIQTIGSTTGISAIINQSTEGPATRIAMSPSAVSVSDDNIQPLLKATNADAQGGYSRWTLDRVGLPAGRLWGIQENWMWPISPTLTGTLDVLANGVWSSFRDDANNTWAQTMVAGWPEIEFTLSSTAPSTSYLNLGTTRPFINFEVEPRVFSGEWDFHNDGLTEHTIFVGLKEGMFAALSREAGNIDNYQAYGFFFDPALSANWHALSCENGSLATVVELPGTTSADYQTFKLIVDSTVNRIHWYVNGAWAFSSGLSLGTTQDLYFGTMIQRTNGTSNTETCQISPINIWATRYENPGDI